MNTSLDRINKRSGTKNEPTLKNHNILPQCSYHKGFIKVIKRSQIGGTFQYTAISCHSDQMDKQVTKYVHLNYCT